MIFFLDVGRSFQCSTANCTVLKNCSTFKTIKKALIHNCNVKFISQVDKMLTVKVGVCDLWQKRRHYGQVMYIITTSNTLNCLSGGKRRTIKMIPVIKKALVRFINQMDS